MNIDETRIKHENLTKLIHFETMSKVHPEPMEKLIKEIIVELHNTKMGPNKKYKKYAADQIECFIRALQEEGMTVPKATKLCDTLCSTRYKTLDDFSNGSSSPVLGSYSKKNKK